ncbi:ABC transporter ATP-binding protein [Chitinimonas naiadis]
MAVTPNNVAAGDGKQQFLQIKGVTKKFGDFYAVDDVNLVIPKNEIFALLGSSGSGKSTLLRMLAGMETPTEGRIILDGEDITDLSSYQRPTNMMFQSYALFPHMTVEQNIAFGLKQDKVPKDEIVDRVGKLLDLVQMRKYAKRKPHQLSGGQQQRVALARSLAKRPKLLLLDEPLGALDKKLRVQTQFELVNVIETVGVTCIMVTHDQEEAMTMASRIAIMSEGKLEQVGGPREIYEFPNSRFTAEFIGSTNIFEGKLSIDEPDHIVIDSADLGRGIYVDHGITGPKGMTVWYSIRPEDVTLCRQKPESQYNWAEGKVHDIAYLGSHSVYHVKLASGRIVIANVPTSHWGNEKPATWGDEVVVKWSDGANGWVPGSVLTS